MLEVEGPTSADAGVASCPLVNAEPVFRHLRDELFDGKILVDMIRRGWKRATKAIRGKSSRELRNFRGAGKQFEQSDSSNGEAGVDTISMKTKTRTSKLEKNF